MRSLVPAALMVAASLLPCVALGQEPPADGEDTAASAVEVEDLAPSAELVRDLRTTEEQVRNLKERVFRSKATLQLLRELVIAGAGSGASLRVTHVDSLPRVYSIQSAEYFLDGRSVWTWEGGPDQEAPDEIEVRDELIDPGPHTVQVSMVLRGNGGGVFNYVDELGVRLEGSCDVEVEGGQLTDLRVRIVARGGVKKSFTDRPTVECEERREQLESE